jgi:hypothetical protein
MTAILSCSDRQRLRFAEVDRALHSLPAVEGAMFSFSPKAFGATIAIERGALDPPDDTLAKAGS